MSDREQSYSVVALEPVQHEGRQLGHVRRVFYRSDGIRGEDAAIRALRAIGQPIADRLGAEQLLRDIHRLPPEET